MESRYIDTRVVVYFSGNMGHIYQIDQWIKPLEALNKTETVLIVIRNTEVYEWMQANTQFQLAYAKTMTTLLKLYEDNSFKCILYVNNSSTNFQSLSNNTALHVHINHGESEKTSTFSNRAKAYDFVFIVADAAYEKYESNLININMNKFIKIGRPQIDFIEDMPARNKPKTDKKIILYAPTWEGTHLSMDYTSLPDYGLDFVKKILDHKGYYLIYRPHPNTGSRDPLTKQADQKIRELIAHFDHAKVMDKESINSVFELADLAIFDNSAVTVDFLAFDSPMLLTDYFFRQEGQVGRKPKIVEASVLINESNKDSILDLIEESLTHDPKKNQREVIKSYFLGDYPHGKSTQIFIEKVKDLIKLNDDLVSSV